MPNIPLSAIPTAPVTANTFLVGLDTVGITHTDGLYTIADIASFVSTLASGVVANVNVVAQTGTYTMLSYSNPVLTTFSVSGYLNVTALSGGSTMQYTMHYIDENGIGIACFCALVDIAGNITNLVTTTGVYAVVTCNIRALAGIIRFNPVLTGTGTFDAGGTLTSI